MSKLFTFLILSLAITFVVILGNLSIKGIDPNANLISVTDNQLSSVQNGQIIIVNSSSVPTLDSSISSTSGNIFTDMFNAVLKWFKTTPIGQVTYNTVTYPPQLFNSLLPVDLRASVGAFWFLIAFFAFIGWAFARD